ncbi:MAG: phosphate/phosphite/phosphonate ABC transporter substrate-binding protein [Magnetococcales bacterium]|nr:phosphate/phosphite/phosphonate ABC transporter substrate-binding protein [Magnetococcales bacterium]
MHDQKVQLDASSTIILLICALLLLPVKYANADVTYTFSFVPQQSATVLARKWGPILRSLSKTSGHKLQFRTAPKIPVFEQRVAAGDYDFVYVNPAHHVVFHREVGYRAFAKQKGKRIKGIIVVRKDAPIQSLQQLSDTTLAFPAPAAFAASVLPRSYISQQGIPFTPKYVGSHDSVYRGVASGRFPAGGGIQRTFGTSSATVRDQLRVLWTTQGYTPHAFAAHPRVPPKVVEAVQNALVTMFDDPVGKKLLQKVGFKQGVEVAADSDWDDVRALGITTLPGGE